MSYSDFDDEVVHDKRASSPQVDEGLVKEIEQDIRSTTSSSPMEGISFVGSSTNLFANADQEPVTAEIFMADTYQQTPLEIVEPFQGMRIRGRAQNWYRQNGLAIHDQPRARGTKKSATQKHMRNSTLADYMYNQLVLEVIKYNHHLHEEPTTRRSLDTYQSRRADVVKSLLRNHSLIYPAVMKSLRRADTWTQDPTLED
ncbi:hypothetical protein EDC96DRAFT_581936 [Choanephora cucurbitarum]|nr:hypothetical protein EDC96DRAFT_581936 [Choanephora cucurbitarum]